MADHSWEQPGAFQIGEGVYRIPLPLPNDGLRAVNVYAIADGEQVVLVDSGWALDESRAQLEKALATIGYELGDVGQFLVTHVHRDHYSQAVAIRRTFATRVRLGEGEREALQAIQAAVAAGEVAPQQRLLRAGAATLVAELRQHRVLPSGDDYEDPDGWLADGADLELASRTLRVIATPGHTRGHVVFHDAAAGALFAGDHVLPHITPSIAVEPVPPPLPLGDYLQSLRLMRTLPDSRLLPAHGPVAPSVHARVDELLEHHEQRLDATCAAVQAGADTGYEVARALLWTRRGRRFDEMDLFNRMLAVNETVAHLDVLVARNRLTVATSADGVAHYSR